MIKPFQFTLAGAAVIALGLPVHGLPDKTSPTVTLYQRFPEAGRQPNAPAVSFPELKQRKDGYWEVDFLHLASFPFTRLKPADEFNGHSPENQAFFNAPETNPEKLPTAPGTIFIPDNVQALDGKRVRLTGYMLPIKLENGLVKDFLLLRNQMMCCFGRQPAPNEWVVVRMKGAGVSSKMDTPLSLFGILHVGELFENKIFEGLYELDGEKISEN